MGIIVCGLIVIIFVIYSMKNKEKSRDLIVLGQNIRSQRKSLGYTQESFALKIGLDRSYIGGIERGERNISYTTLVKIARNLNCNLELFAEGIADE